VTFDGTYYYAFDAEGNRIAKYLSGSGALDDTAIDITTYTWDNRNRMTMLTHTATYGATPDLQVQYTFDISNRMVDEKEIVGGSLDERYLYDGNNLLEVLDSSDDVVERYLNGPAVDQVLAVEQVGGENSGVNWLLADAQGTVRDVVREASGGGDGPLTSVVDHLFFDAYGNQTTAQTATDPQLQSRIGFEGMMTDPLVGFPAADSAGGLYYSAAQGWYDAVVGTFVTAVAQGYSSGVTNPFEFSGNNPTATDLSMASQPEESSSAVGIMDSGGGDATPVSDDSAGADQVGDGSIPILLDVKQAVSDAVTTAAEAVFTLIQANKKTLTDPKVVARINAAAQKAKDIAPNVVNLDPNMMGWLDLTLAWFLELGPVNWKFGPDAAITQDVLELQGVKDQIAIARKRYQEIKGKDHAATIVIVKDVKFGVDEAYKTLMEMDKAFAFLGSYRITITYSGENMKVVVTNTTGWQSGTRFRVAAQPGGQHRGILDDRQLGSGGIELGGNITLEFTLFVPWEE
jgi:hypothetical protein